ncbi:hypothetical protein ACFOSC_05875 [Streptantibioticus rubrisoli]|uniref:Secreted protein n=1 Tax=Streptantibioticus rubrisoli TaxID=1387313 RepID=A0ABT1PDI3_9ACTN|nr:hypothetical protein [Streptantibioticus rubrisoli]MCQ4043427.1 hypothetical protein [Streptantibioticus rubrisoli]
MQPSAGQDLPHTRTHPAHWLATGVAIAAVVGLAALVRPAGAAATGARSAPDAAAAHYPVNCGGGPVDVVARASGDIEGDGRADTVAVVRCHTDFGTPPSGVYVLSAGTSPGAPPKVVATLVDPARKLSVRDLYVTGRTVSATLLGYSSDTVPRCCPDLRREFGWHWHDGRFTAVPGPHAGSV